MRPMPPAPLVASALNEVTPDMKFHFDYPGADIILRSCDSHTFRVPKLNIINISDSPILRDLIQNVSNTSDVTNGEEQPLPTVKLPENGATLRSLLDCIFSFAPILPSTSEEIMELLSVAQKYQMESALAHIRGAISLLDPPFIHLKTAFHHYALAQRNELRPEAVQAARATLRLTLTLETLEDKIDFMPGAYLRELWQYHERVRANLKSALHEFRKSGLPSEVKGLHCPSSTSRSSSRTLPRWLDDYVKSLPDALHLFSLIELENVRARHVKDEISRYGYAACSSSNISSQTICAFWDALSAVVRETIEKTDSTLALVKEEPAFEFSDPSSIPLCLDTPDANIILRSADQVTFRVHKSVLAMSSPFFKDLLSLPQPPDGELVDGLPVIQLSEGSGLLTSLVSLLYPIDPIVPDSYQKVFAVLAACQKYDMTPVQSRIRAEMKRGAFPGPVGAEAFRAYAIASTMDLVPEMEDAVHLTRNFPMTFESLGEALASFRGQALRDLLRSRKRSY